MFLLLLWVTLAVGVSFVCSLLEAVLLSARRTALIDARDKGSAGAARMLQLKGPRLNDAIAAILSLNTIAHTIGASLAGAQAAYRAEEERSAGIEHDGCRDDQADEPEKARHRGIDALEIARV